MATNNPPKKIFVVGNQQVRVRPKPSRSAPETRWLQPGERIECEADSRTEAEGHIWWQHREGWTAERSLDGKYTYLTEVVAPAPAPTVTLTESSPAAVTPAPAPTVAPSPAPAPAPAPAPVAPTTPNTRTFEVGRINVRVRSIPSSAGILIRELTPGTQITVDLASRTEAGGYVWWKHKDGWSVERKLDNSEVYLYEPGKAPLPAPAPAPLAAPATEPDVNTLPLVGTMFKRFPVDLAQTLWWQYFGNNCYAQKIWGEGKRWYQYCQGLHGGLDFGNSTTRGVPVFAGVEGIYIKTDTMFTRPNGIWVKVGDYTVIYGHLANPTTFTKDQPIYPDTFLGQLDFGGQNHLHLEIRYRGTWVVNPLVFFPKDMQEQILKKFPPGVKYFYADATWSRWQTPYDQPALRLGGAVIGPWAR
jgi:murein DD-endopeptidase MepM/ murein hydrolase activator NlpD